MSEYPPMVSGETIRRRLAKAGTCQTAVGAEPCRRCGSGLMAEVFELGPDNGRMICLACGEMTEEVRRGTEQS